MRLLTQRDARTLQAQKALTMTSSDLTRRELLELTAATGGVLAGGQLMPGAISPAAAQGAGPDTCSARCRLRVNGTEHRLTLDPRTTLLDALREHLQLTGSKKGCGLGQCGACTVLMDGKRVKVVPLARGARGGARDHDHRGPGPRRASSTRCRRPSSSATPSSAATARPGRSWPASPASPRATPARRRRSATG